MVRGLTLRKVVLLRVMPRVLLSQEVVRGEGERSRTGTCWDKDRMLITRVVE